MPDRPPFLVTGKELDRVLDQRDAVVEKTIDAFKVETVERLDAFGKLLDQVENVMVGLLGAVQVSNLIQPDPESMDVQYFVADQHGFMQSTTSGGFDRARAEGRTAFRQVTVLERYETDPDKYAQVQDVVTQVRQEIQR